MNRAHPTRTGSRLTPSPAPNTSSTPFLISHNRVLASNAFSVKLTLDADKVHPIEKRALAKG